MNITLICSSTDLYSDVVRCALECDGNALWKQTVRADLIIVIGRKMASWSVP